MKKYLLGIGMGLALGASALQASIQYELSDFEKSNTNFSVGTVQIDGKNYFKTAINPDLTLGPLQVGFDLNLYLGDKVPSELQSVVLRRIAYDHNQMAGIEWGRLKNVTYGYGLLVDRYDSGSFGSAEFNADKAGTKGYLNFSPVRLDAMYTNGEVLSGRVSYTLSDSVLGSIPIVFGGTYVQDKDGLDKTYNGESLMRPETEAWGVDIGLPIGGQYFTPFVEYATYEKGLDGSGTSTGILGDFGVASYRLEYRMLDKGFIPNYYNNLYEATGLAIDDIPTEKLKGFVGTFTASLNDYIRAGIVYESYDKTDPVLSGALGWQRIGNVTGVVNYTRSFKPNSSARLSSDMLFHTDGGIDYVVHYNKTYYPNGTEQDSYSVSLRMGLKAFGLPF